jgi:hypothetical protein
MMVFEMVLSIDFFSFRGNGLSDEKYRMSSYLEALDIPLAKITNSMTSCLISGDIGSIEVSRQPPKS